MKNIKENQEGLKALADERPDVVKKMGYDPESFYGGGLAMLANGGSVDPDSAIDLFKMKSENDLRDFIGKNAISKILGDVLRGRDVRDALEEGGINQILKESNIPLRKDGKEIIFDVNPEFSFYRNPMETGIRFEKKFNEGGILKANSGSRVESRRSRTNENTRTNENKGVEELLEEVITPDYTMEQTGDISEDDYKKMYVGEADALNPEKDKKLSKSEKALAILEGLGSLSNLMPQGFTTRGGIGEAIGPNMVPITRVGMADGGIAEMANGGMAEEQLQRLLEIIQNSPLDSDEKNLQKQIARMQLAQQTMVGTPQYIPTDAPYKAVYRPYFSEVTKAYNAARPGATFSPLAGPSRERVDFNLGMRSDGTLGGPRRVAGVQYAADGMLIDGQFFPETDERVEGPGGERDDKIPAMLSDGEFVVNAKTVRGLGLQAGANPMDFEEQRNIGSKVLEYLQDTMGPRGDIAAKMGEQGLGALVRSMP